MNIESITERYKNILSEDELTRLIASVERLSKEDPDADLSFAIPRYAMRLAANHWEVCNVDELIKLSPEEIRSWLDKHIHGQDFKEELYRRILQEKNNRKSE